MGAIELYTGFSDKPIKELFQAIVVLQELENCDDEVVSLSVKLAKLFDDIPEREGKKTYAHAVKYFASGLCEWGCYRVILPPWESEFLSREDNKVKKQNRRDPAQTIVVRDDFNHIWYGQLKVYLNQKFTPSKEKVVSLKDLANKLMVMDNLTDEERELLENSNINRVKEDLGNALGDLFDVNRWHGENKKFHFLTDDELAIIAKTIDDARGLSKSDVYLLVNDKLKHIKESSDRVTIDLSNLWESYKQPYEAWNGETRYNDRIRVNPAGFDEVVKQLYAVEDENIKKVLELYGIM